VVLAGVVQYWREGSAVGAEAVVVAGVVPERGQCSRTEYYWRDGSANGAEALVVAGVLLERGQCSRSGGSSGSWSINVERKVQ
jgi:hypothetical protein